VDRRWWRAEDPAHRGEIRTVHQLHTRSLPGLRTSPKCLRSTGRELGTDFDAIVRSVNVNAVVGTSEAVSMTGCSTYVTGWSAMSAEAAADAMIGGTGGPIRLLAQRNR